MIDIVFITFVSIIPALALPGPSLIAVASAGLHQGRRAAIFVAAGVSAGVFIWAFLVAVGLGALFQTYPGTLLVLKLLGGGYLAWLSLMSLRMAWRNRPVDLGTSLAKSNPLTLFRSGLVIVVTNPTGALMWAAVTSFLFGSGLSKWQVAALSPAFSVAAFLVYGGYSIVFSTGTAVATYRRFWRITETVFGGLFGALGISLIVDALRQINGA